MGCRDNEEDDCCLSGMDQGYFYSDQGNTSDVGCTDESVGILSDGKYNSGGYSSSGPSGGGYILCLIVVFVLF